jgi:acyl-lipid omega-6 desaturase (Delta-12 desaturase)
VTTQAPRKEKPVWAKIVKQYQKADHRSWVQIANTFIPLAILYVLMYLSMNISYVLTLLLAPIAAGLTVRVFIIQHDAGHGSFFKNNKLNNRIGIFCSLFTLTPFEFWRHSHAVHHAHNGDLEWRGTGDVDTWTFEEYRAATPRQRFWYRIYRHPLMMIVFGPPIMFLILHRTPFALKHARGEKERLSIIRTDIMAIVAFAFFSLLIGPQTFFMIWFPTAWMTASMGVWMFYVQHQFEDAYWTVKPDWDYADAALHGSTFYRLPKWLHWFTGNIGYHHIHHLSPKIPNYELERAHKENEQFQDVPTLTVWSSIKLVISNLAIIDEEQGKLINFPAAHRKLAALEAAESRQQALNKAATHAGTD